MIEQENQSSDLFGDLTIDPMAKQYLRSMSGWAMVIVVVSVIGYIFSVIDLFREKRPASFNRAEGFDMGFTESSTGAEVFTSLLSIAIGLLINYFLYRFARQAKAGVDGLNQPELNKSFGNLKAYFMACSIILIIAFVLLLLGAMVLGTRTAMQ
ncbi:MAG: hypothetical protein J0I32_21830 [Sphingobacteriales bacterium]|nr:hypothetical protein [Sphingobacteriales bacterium]OJW03361.1 MAG: hypothetical protein BGO52_23650 [Sphingobacteriales bacterium 44-61]